MLKECKVLLNNDAVTVIRYDNIDVQIPALGYKVDIVKVKDDGHYTVVHNDYIEQKAFQEKTRARKKKSIVREENTEQKVD